MLDEKALRKPGFSEGYAVTLADGQAWTFPKRSYSFYPEISEDGTVTLGRESNFGGNYDRQLDILFRDEDADDSDLMLLQFRLSVDLLKRNYDLTGDDFRQILRLDSSAPESQEMWNSIAMVLMGIVPKPSAGGSAGA